MYVTGRDGLITDISVKNILSGKVSLFRHYQNIFLSKYGKDLTGNIIELGGEESYKHGRFFPNASSFVCTNVNRDYKEYVDITNMPFADGTQDAYVCVSVCEHVYSVQKAFSEIDRTLKIGGKLLLVIPFAYPFHDEQDYWRLGESAYKELFRDYEIKAFIHLGGLFSTIVTALQRPIGILTARYLLYKSLGLFVAVFFKHLERLDGFPIGYGIYAIKKRQAPL